MAVKACRYFGGMTVWLTPQQVSDLTGMRLAHLKKLRCEKKGFPYYKPTERVVLYNADDVEQRIRASRVETRD